MRLQTTRLWPLAIILLWLAHALGYLIHEYAHSVTAWILHAKANPFALNYGHLTVTNVLIQEYIDENVDYEPLFAAGRSHAAALIAVAGVLIGNGLSYILSRIVYGKARQRRMVTVGIFAFWLCLMSVGNFLSYVPLRTFATHADMHTTAMGLHASPWLLAVGLGIPFAIALVHFFMRMLPDAMTFLFSADTASQCVMVLVTSYLVFGFFGSAGMRNYGVASHWMSALCVYALFPLTSLLCWPRRSA